MRPDNQTRDPRERERHQSNIRRQRLLALAAVAVMAVLSIAAFAWSRSGGNDPAADSAGPNGHGATVATVPRPADLQQVGPAGPGLTLQAEAAPATVSGGGSLAGIVICIDPGHAASSDSGVEPIGPGSGEMKVKDPGGTSGAATGVRESVVTLAISLQLKAALEAQGATVVMTRSGADFSGGNRERAQVANQAGASLFIRIHADGSADQSRRGVSTLYPANIPGWTDDIYEQSRAAAAAVQAAMVSRLGTPDLGTVERSDITGFNWADVPAILVETGFMSNPGEDALLNDPAYQQQVAAALAAGISAYHP
ncbi:MAG: N-acetylmuramoyl-L-alanine amidase family protein [Thermoleophilia bacterium]